VSALVSDAQAIVVAENRGLKSRRHRLRANARKAGVSLHVLKTPWRGRHCGTPFAGWPSIWPAADVRDLQGSRAAPRC